MNCEKLRRAEGGSKGGVVSAGMRSSLIATPAAMCIAVGKVLHPL